MNAPAPRRPVVGIFGTFDVENYGDLLFPLIARRQLRDVARVVAVSPTSDATRFGDARAPVSVDAFAQGEAPAAVLIGGGNIVHLRDFGIEAYRNVPGHVAYPALWMGATMLGAAHRCPVIWNAPGVLPLKKAGPLDELIAATLAGAAHLAVRDDASAAILSGFGATAAVVPDTALGLDTVWPRRRLARVLRERLAAAGIERDQATLAVHVKARALGDLSVEAFAATLDASCTKLKLAPVLIAIGRIHGDGELAREVAARLTVPHATLDAPDTLQEIAAAIACSRAAVIASLHGFITATAYGTPAALVAVPALEKFRGFAGQVLRGGDVVADWPAAFARLEALAQAGWPAPADPVEARAAVAGHWDAVRALISGGTTAAQPRPLADGFVRTALAAGGITPLLAAAIRPA